MWRYRNPVEVRFGAGTFDGLGKALAGRAYCLVTYDDANGGGTFAELTRRVDRHGRRTRCPGAQHRPQSGFHRPRAVLPHSMPPPRSRSRRSWPWAAAR